MGNGETAIFPISIFKVYDGINFKPGDPNYDLYRYAMEVTARRLFPNFVFGDAPFNYQYYKPGHPETEIVAMGCRTRVIGNVNGPEIVPKRGNCSFTTINLPRLGIKHGKVSEGGLDLDAFFADLDKQLELVEKELLDRYEYQGKKKVKNFPFLMGEGLWMDSETLGSEDTLESVIKHGTLSIGFIGLAECLVALIGKHHGESAEAQELGLKIIKRMRDYTDEATKRTHLNFSVLATPSEGLSGRFVRIDKKVYGIIPGVTDREYYTNSMHCPVYYPMNAFDKIEIEAAYHPYCNAGHICYVELDGDVTKNIDAIEEILAWMKECGIGYGSLNHPVDYDPICGYVGIIGDTCPRCGRKEYEGVPIQRLKKLGVWKEYNSKYIGYTGDLQEEEDRIPNLYVTKKED